MIFMIFHDFGRIFMVWSGDGAGILHLAGAQDPFSVFAKLTVLEAQKELGEAPQHG